MRTLVFVLMLVGFPLSALGQEVVIDLEQAPEPVEWNVEFMIPNGWHVNEAGRIGIFLSTTPEKDWVPEVPSSPHAWFVVVKRLGANCEQDEALRQFSRTDKEKPFLAAVGCKQGLTVVAGYWESDPQKDSRSLQMLEMYASLRLKPDR